MFAVPDRMVYRVLLPFVLGYHTFFVLLQGHKKKESPQSKRPLIFFLLLSYYIMGKGDCIGASTFLLATNTFVERNVPAIDIALVTLFLVTIAESII